MKKTQLSAFHFVTIAREINGVNKIYKNHIGQIWDKNLGTGVCTIKWLYKRDSPVHHLINEVKPFYLQIGDQVQVVLPEGKRDFFEDDRLNGWLPTNGEFIEVKDICFGSIPGREDFYYVKGNTACVLLEFVKPSE